MSGGMLGKLYLAISGDTKPLRRDLNSAEQMVRGSSTKMSGSLKMVGAAMAGIAAFQGFRMLTDGMMASVKAASDLEEVTSKFGVVFKGQEDAARKMSDTLVDSYAMSTREAKHYLSSVQDLLVPMGMASDRAAGMSGEVVKLSADLGSFNNLPTAQVMDDIQSALVGNYETMKKYGVVLNATVVQEKALAMGLAGTKKELTAAHKAQAAYKLMVKGSTAAIGDMARTQDSYANQLKQLESNVEEVKGALGAALLPAMRDVVEKMNEWIKENSKLIEQDLPAHLRNAAGAATLLAKAVKEIAGFINFPESAGLNKLLELAQTMGGVENPKGFWGVFDDMKLGVGQREGQIGRLQDKIRTWEEDQGSWRGSLFSDQLQEQIDRAKMKIGSIQNEISDILRRTLPTNPGDAQWSLHLGEPATPDYSGVTDSWLQKRAEAADLEERTIKDLIKLDEERLSAQEEFAEQAEKIAADATRRAYEEHKKRREDDIAAGEQMTDFWLLQHKEREAVHERSMEQIKKNVDDALGDELAEVDAHQDKIVQEYEDMQKEVERIWDNLVENVQSAFGDSFYRMFDEGIKGFDDFFDQILDMFKRLLADMAAAWVTKGMVGLLSGTFGGFSIPGLGISGGSFTSALGGSSAGAWLAGLGGAAGGLGAAQHAAAFGVNEGTQLALAEGLYGKSLTSGGTSALSWGGAVLNPATIAPFAVYGAGEALDALKDLRGKKIGPGDWLGFYDAGLTDAPAGWRTPSFKDEADEWTKNFQDASADFVSAMRRTFEENGNRFSRIKLEVDAPESIPVDVNIDSNVNLMLERFNYSGGTITTYAGGGSEIPSGAPTNYRPNPGIGGDDVPTGISSSENETRRGAGKAFGGSVFAGWTYPVGERGPELFTPEQDGTIIPNHMLNGGSKRPQYFTFHLGNEELRSYIREETEDVVVNLRRRGVVESPGVRV